MRSGKEEACPHEVKVKRAEHLRDARRTLIVKAARDVFAREGLDGASMRSIARSAGCTTGAIYPYFHGKEELYSAVLREALEQLHLAVGAAIDTSNSEDPRTRASAGVLAFYEFYKGRPDDLTLGLYLSNGLKPVGLGCELDVVLNHQLGETLSLIESCAERAYGFSAQEWTAGAIAQCMGILIMEHTGRLMLWQIDGADLLKKFLQD